MGGVDCDKGCLLNVCIKLGVYCCNEAVNKSGLFCCDNGHFHLVALYGRNLTKSLWSLCVEDFKDSKEWDGIR